jgi:prepilin-type processing-associated H-X9-DG protein
VRSLRLGSLVLVAALVGSSAVADAAPAHPLGVTLEAGAPDLVSVRLTLRPRTWLRLGFGPVSDLFSAGIGGGITIVPLKSLVAPSLTIDGGYLFDGDTRGIPQALGVPIGNGRAAYGYVDGHAGLEIGANRRVCFFVHAGVSYVDLTAHGDGFATAHLRVWGPSAKLGLTVFL